MKKWLSIAAVIMLAGCASSSGPSESEKVRNLPAVSFASAMTAFQRVCAASRPNFTDAEARTAQLASPSAYIFTVDRLSNGSPVCTMRARLPEGTDAFFELQERYGRARFPLNAPLLQVFDGYPNGQLVFMGGIKGGAGEGTFQVGLTTGTRL
ncbi:MAG: hypothetical protein AAF222_12095 [Pseudomonadota bacterium]